LEESTRRRSVRLEDIAQQVGVSRSEVSRVLNDRQRAGRAVGQAKQLHIQQVARELGYQPNKAAQNLAKGRTDLVGLVLQPLGDQALSPHYHEIIGGLMGVLAEQGLHLLLHQCPYEASDSLVSLARAHTCDVLILTDIRKNDLRPALLRELGQPFVIRGSAPEPDLLAIGMDNQAVGRLAIETLAGYGHRKILFHNIGRDLMSGEGRYQGCHAACTELGLGDTLNYEDTIWGEEGVYALVRERFSQPNSPTAIFTADELAALGALRALKDLGKRVPEDVSLLTGLNARFMHRTLSGISTIQIRQHEIATELGQSIGKLLRGEPIEKMQHFLSPVLADSGSCAVLK
jgi:LacI family transcriptional regulator